MTRTEIQRRELSENERHNRVMEHYKKIDSVFNAAGTVAGAYNAAGSLIKGASSMISAKKPNITKTQLLRQSGDTFQSNKHYHKHYNFNNKRS